MPVLFIAAGDEAAKGFVEFFTANIRNPHTREAYYRAACYFSAWCEHRGLALADIQPVHVAAYIEMLSKTVNQQTRKVYGKATVKQHLAAIRMLFDWLVVGQVVPFNPAPDVLPYSPPPLPRALSPSCGAVTPLFPKEGS